MDKYLEKYKCEGLLNTIFFGRGNKNKVILKMLNPNNNETEIENYWENQVPFFSTNTYIRFDSRDFLHSKIELSSILEELSKNRTITSQCSKIFFVQNINCLANKEQERFRQIIEDSYYSRFIFTCENIDSLDPAIISRCFLIQIKTENESYTNSDTEYHKTILKNMGIHEPEQLMADILLKELKQCDTLKKIHVIADKIHTSEIDIVNMFKESEIHSIRDIQKYAAKKNPTQFDCLLLLLKIKKSL